MTTITKRTSVFETNSSSTHSISIAPGNSLFSSISPNGSGQIILTGGEFGWEWVKYNDSLTKANYAAVMALNDDDRKTMLEEVIKTHTGAKEVIFDLSTDYNSSSWSYIDHQSVGKLDEIFSSETSLKNFLFNDKVFLCTGNDNCSPPSNFFDHDLSGFDYVVSLEGTEEVCRIKKKDVKNHTKIIEILQDLFERNDNNKYSKSSWSSNEDDYSISWKDRENQFDFDAKTVRLVSKKPVYNKKGEFIEYRIDKEKFLTFNIAHEPFIEKSKR